MPRQAPRANDPIRHELKPPDTMVGAISEIAQAIGASLMGGAASTITGLADFAAVGIGAVTGQDPTELPMWKWREDTQKYWQDLVPERLANSWQTLLGGAVGSGLGFIATGGLTGTVGKGFGMVGNAIRAERGLQAGIDAVEGTIAATKAVKSGNLLTRVGRYAIDEIKSNPGIALLGGAMNAGSTYREARDMGYTNNEALVRMGVGFGLGLSEAIGLGTHLTRIDRVTGGKFTGLLMWYGREALEEGSQEFGQNLAQGVFDLLYQNDKNKAEFGQVLQDSFKQGGAAALSAILLGTVGGVQNYKARLEYRDFVLAEKARAEANPDAASSIIDKMRDAASKSGEDVEVASLLNNTADSIEKSVVAPRAAAALGQEAQQLASEGLPMAAEAKAAAANVASVASKIDPSTPVAPANASSAPGLAALLNPDGTPVVQGGKNNAQVQDQGGTGKVNAPAFGPNTTLSEITADGRTPTVRYQGKIGKLRVTAEGQVVFRPNQTNEEYVLGGAQDGARTLGEFTGDQQIEVLKVGAAPKPKIAWPSAGQESAIPDSAKPENVLPAETEKAVNDALDRITGTDGYYAGFSKDTQTIREAIAEARAKVAADDSLNPGQKLDATAPYDQLEQQLQSAEAYFVDQRTDYNGQTTFGFDAPVTEAPTQKVPQVAGNTQVENPNQQVFDFNKQPAPLRAQTPKAPAATATKAKLPSESVSGSRPKSQANGGATPAAKSGDSVPIAKAAKAVDDGTDVKEAGKTVGDATSLRVWVRDFVRGLESKSLLGRKLSEAEKMTLRNVHKAAIKKSGGDNSSVDPTAALDAAKDAVLKLARENGRIDQTKNGEPINAQFLVGSKGRDEVRKSVGRSAIEQSVPEDLISATSGSNTIAAAPDVAAVSEETTSAVQDLLNSTTAKAKEGSDISNRSESDVMIATVIAAAERVSGTPISKEAIAKIKKDVSQITGNAITSTKDANLRQLAQHPQIQQQSATLAREGRSHFESVGDNLRQAGRRSNTRNLESPAAGNVEGGQSGVSGKPQSSGAADPGPVRQDYRKDYIPRTYTKAGVPEGVDKADLYDIATDPLGLAGGLSDEATRRGYRKNDLAARLTVLETRIRDAGFKGYVNAVGDATVFTAEDNAAVRERVLAVRSEAAANEDARLESEMARLRPVYNALLADAQKALDSGEKDLSKVLSELPPELSAQMRDTLAMLHADENTGQVPNLLAALDQAGKTGGGVDYQKQLSKALATAGKRLLQNVRINLKAAVAGNAEGLYDPNTRTIELAMTGKRDRVHGALNHETIHAVAMDSVRKYYAGENIPAGVAEAIRNLESIRAFALAKLIADDKLTPGLAKIAGLPETTEVERDRKTAALSKALKSLYARQFNASISEEEQAKAETAYSILRNSYGLFSLDEFVTEVMTNRQLGKLLNEMSADGLALPHPSPGKLSNLWAAVRRAFRNLVFGGERLNESSVLAKAFDSTMDFLNESTVQDAPAPVQTAPNATGPAEAVSLENQIRALESPANSVRLTPKQKAHNEQNERFLEQQQLEPDSDKRLRWISFYREQAKNSPSRLTSGAESGRYGFGRLSRPAALRFLTDPADLDSVYAVARPATGQLLIHPEADSYDQRVFPGDRAAQIRHRSAVFDEEAIHYLHTSTGDTAIEIAARDAAELVSDKLSHGLGLYYRAYGGERREFYPEEMIADPDLREEAFVETMRQVVQFSTTGRISEEVLKKWSPQSLDKLAAFKRLLTEWRQEIAAGEWGPLAADQLAALENSMRAAVASPAESLDYRADLRAQTAWMRDRAEKTGANLNDPDTVALWAAEWRAVHPLAEEVDAAADTTPSGISDPDIQALDSRWEEALTKMKKDGLLSVDCP